MVEDSRVSFPGVTSPEFSRIIHAENTFLYVSGVLIVFKFSMRNWPIPYENFHTELANSLQTIIFPWGIDQIRMEISIWNWPIPHGKLKIAQFLMVNAMK